MTDALVPVLDDSPLALSGVHIGPGDSLTVSETAHDSLLYVYEGEGTVRFDAPHSLTPGTSLLVLAGEHAELSAEGELHAILATVGPDADRHAPLGAREHVVRLADAEARRATGSRSFQILFGADNGSTRATLFVGFIPPGKAPWHYHLYDEIVWVPEGPGRLHLGEGTDELGPGSAFRLRPREVHIVENASADREMAILGIFTPAGSPSAAYLAPDVAAEYRFVDQGSR